MASVVKQADTTIAQPIAKIEDGLLHLGSVSVEQALHLEAQAFQRCCHIASVVEWVTQRAALVIGIADYEGVALDGGREVEREQESAGEDEEFVGHGILPIEPN